VTGDLARHWLLEPEIDFLNHGSFGACPLAVLEAQQQWRRRMESEPVRFLAAELEGHLDEAREELARFVGARGDDLAFIANVTTGVNIVLRSLFFTAGDELLVTDHEYNACSNALRFAAERSGATVRVVSLPFPIASPDVVVERILAATGPRTRLALLDHITSPSGLILPIEKLVRELDARGIDTLVDGAHGPGMVLLELDRLGAAYYTGNCHKWLCAPKGAAFLHVRRDRQERIRPLTISHGANATRTDRSRFRLEFDWMGTPDPTPWLAVPVAIRFLDGLLPGGWREVMRANRELALEGRRLLCEAVGAPAPAPEEMIGALASVPLPDGSPQPPASPLYRDPLQERLLAEHRIQVPVLPWPAPPRRLVRISAQLYNRREQYRRLAAVLPRLLRD
jgi:isopenicillin-N epimerase